VAGSCEDSSGPLGYMKVGQLLAYQEGLLVT
jgi:hypothetical protein